MRSSSFLFWVVDQVKTYLADLDTKQAMFVAPQNAKQFRRSKMTVAQDKRRSKKRKAKKRARRLGHA